MLNFDEPLSTSAFKLNLRRYIMDRDYIDSFVVLQSSKVGRCWFTLSNSC
jgi:hypothetical protein